MKKQLFEYLQNHWTSGRDNDIIKDFLNDFFSQLEADEIQKTEYKLAKKLKKLLC